MYRLRKDSPHNALRSSRNPAPCLLAATAAMVAAGMAVLGCCHVISACCRRCGRLADEAAWLPAKLDAAEVAAAHGTHPSCAILRSLSKPEKAAPKTRPFS